MPRWISLFVALIALVALCSAGGYVVARSYEYDAFVGILSMTLKGSFYALAACCGYAVLVGVYHTFLSVTGLDEEREEDAGRGAP